ncbi:MAG: ankyrin repeat domain-containing protein [Leptospira sp.]|nr:ankyrin repeat domain-containing protein [Leptospira sp.]
MKLNLTILTAVIVPILYFTPIASEPYTTCLPEQLKCIENAIKAGESIDFNKRTPQGKDSFIYAMEADHNSFLETIIAYGFMPNEPIFNGSSYLHYAVSLNNKYAVDLLLRNGADPNLTDRNGETALDLALATNNEPIIKLLENHGGRSLKNRNSLTISLYLIYILLSLAVTIWVARTLSKNGYVFLIDAFKDEELAKSVNHLLVVGFYLINIGYISMALKIGLRPKDIVEAIEILSEKIGIVIILLGLMHFFNLYLFGRLRKRTLSKSIS